MERLLDLAARELGIDRVEIRRRNLLAPDDFPARPRDHLPGLRARSIYDSGNYLPALEQAAEMIGYERFMREEQPRLRAEGRHVGIGIVIYVEGTGIGPYEGARVHGRAERQGARRHRRRARRGRATSPRSRRSSPSSSASTSPTVRVVTGDTREFHWGTGTFASRGAVVAGNACHAAARRGAREDRSRWRAELLERARASSSSWPAASVRVAGSTDRAIAPRRAGRQGQPAARRRRARHRARARGHRVLRPRARQHRERRARDDRRGRSARPPMVADQALRRRRTTAAA